MWRASSHTRIVVGRVGRTIMAWLGSIRFNNTVFWWCFIFSAISRTYSRYSNKVIFVLNKLHFLHTLNWMIGIRVWWWYRWSNRWLRCLFSWLFSWFVLRWYKSWITVLWRPWTPLTVTAVRPLLMVAIFVVYNIWSTILCKRKIHIQNRVWAFQWITTTVSRSIKLVTLNLPTRLFKIPSSGLGVSCELMIIGHIH